MSRDFAPEMCHQLGLADPPRTLRFRPGADLGAWRRSLGERLRELVGVMPHRVPLNVRREFEREHPDFLEIRFVFTAEAGADVPCHLLLPRGKPFPRPLVICLQGHSPGMHISLGRATEHEKQHLILEGDRDFAIQAVRQGYAALVMEQRCFGERDDHRTAQRHWNHTCIHASMVSLLLGRTMIGERVWDVSRAIDAMAEFPQVDGSRIACMGNSGGGTITWYAACLEPRIAAAMPSCSICTYRDSIASIDHCTDNYLPRALQFFDLSDLAGLIAPRPLVVVAGQEDPIFPIAGVRECFQGVRSIYAEYRAAEQCQLIVGSAGHRFYADLAWPVFRQSTGWE